MQNFATSSPIFIFNTVLFSESFVLLELTSLMSKCKVTFLTVYNKARLILFSLSEQNCVGFRIFPWIGYAAMLIQLL